MLGENRLAVSVTTALMALLMGLLLPFLLLVR